ncbi:hypothetical protein KQX54_019700 [Cotesia glomerata]|uniref:Uncharacterized protein n=1 Tax=Cotesia glomerata TaxID=32391 RepID=A0AAV7J252_COTGL|nr:hypothetical protein KQX54_019700 [Cotesia glomerata]
MIKLVAGGSEDAQAHTKEAVCPRDINRVSSIWLYDGLTHPGDQERYLENLAQTRTRYCLLYDRHDNDRLGPETGFRCWCHTSGLSF